MHPKPLYLESAEVLAKSGNDAREPQSVEQALLQLNATHDAETFGNALEIWNWNPQLSYADGYQMSNAFPSPSPELSQWQEPA